MDTYLPGFLNPQRRMFTIDDIHSGSIQIIAASPPVGQRAFLFVRRDDGILAVLNARVTPNGRILAVLGACVVNHQDAFRALGLAACAAADTLDEVAQASDSP